MYPFLFRVVLTRIDPERAHHLAFDVIRALPTLGFGRLVRRFTRPRTDLSVHALGLTFDSPFGLAAGFDKDGEAVIGLGQLGFGHVEVGTLTAIAQPGNPRPRLFRLIPDRAVINRMGFNNGGAAAAVRRLTRVRATPGRPVLGINIGKSRVTAVEDATADYLASAAILAPLAERSLAVLRLIRASVPAHLCVISVGGVETAEQVVERLEAGATLVQGYTAFLYRGPLWARQVNRGLDRLLHRP